MNVVQKAQTTLIISSTAFTNEGFIPRKYTCDGENVNPPLYIENILGNTKSLVLIVEDQDAPIGTWDHWVVWDIAPRNEIRENSIPGTEGLNSFRQHNYGGPCPPAGTHRYFFKLYAMDTLLNLPGNTPKARVEKAMAGHILRMGEITGLYKRKI